ncbi:D-hexose-6-phosphate mutarotase [Enemella sp. A6]|uniref:D-hexose-6-phosphate mutarotase n=1 Tax=Enemella sp. A6 TaxID=3440152 RepID=UPI003EBC9EB1
MDLPDISGLTLAEGRGGLPKLDIDVPGGTAELYLQGAHLTSWIPTGHDPVLWVADHAEFAEGKAIRGGVPLCFPWFGPGPDGNMRPSHGFARVTPWRVISAARNGDTVSVTLEFTHADAVGRPGHELWPADFRARYRVDVSDTLTMTLEVDPPTPQAQAALHTYLQVGDVRRVQVEGMDHQDVIDKVTGDTGTHHGMVTFEGETDRIFQTANEAVVHDPVLGRKIVIEKSGSPQTVVWNPGADRAAALPDMGDDEWTGFVCVEAANLVQLVRLCSRLSVTRSEA